MRKKWLKRIIIILIVLLFLAVCAFFLLKYIDEKYTVTNVVVEGNIHYTDEEIEEIVMAGDMGHNSLYLARKYKNAEIKDVPFVETINVSIESKDSIRIYVYEKAIAGFVEYLGRYVYFDKDGIVVEVSNVKTDGVPEVIGVDFEYVVLYQKLPTKDEDLFRKVLDITKLLTKYNVSAQMLYFSDNGNTVMYCNEVAVNLGKYENLDIKILNLPSLLGKIEGIKGTLHMEDYDESTKNVYFEPAKE